MNAANRQCIEFGDVFSHFLVLRVPTITSVPLPTLDIRKCLLFLLRQCLFNVGGSDGNNPDSKCFNATAIVFNGWESVVLLDVCS